MFNWFQKICQTKPMALPAYPASDPKLKGVWKGTGRIDRSMTTETANYVKNRYPQISWLNEGAYGVAFDCKPGTVCKITDQRTEAQNALKFKLNPNSSVVRIFKVSPIQRNNKSLWIIEMEKVKTLNIQEQQVYREIFKCFERNNLLEWNMSFNACLKEKQLAAEHIVGENNPLILKITQGIDNLWKNLDENLLEDAHHNNVGWNEQGNLVIFDLGTVS